MNNKLIFGAVGKDYIYETQISQIERKINVKGSRKRRMYYLAVLNFCKFLDESGYGVFSIDKCCLIYISDNELKEYVKYLKKRKHSNSTIKASLLAIRTYHNYCNNTLHHLSSNDNFNL